MLDRRTFVFATAVTAISAGHARPAVATSGAQIATFDEVMKRIIGDAKPEDGRFTIDLPEIAENGNTVPYSVGLDRPMTDDDHVKALHVVATENPQPLIATFHMGPLTGRAHVSSRLRLAKTQDVVFVAELSNGKFLQARRSVKVTIGGCGG